MDGCLSVRLQIWVREQNGIDLQMTYSGDDAPIFSLLDLSVVFNTINHDILLDQLKGVRRWQFSVAMNFLLLPELVPVNIHRRGDN